MIAKRVGTSTKNEKFNKENKMPVRQTERYDEILTKRIKQAEEMGINGEFIKEILEAVHEESVRTQLDLINK